MWLWSLGFTAPAGVFNVQICSRTSHLFHVKVKSVPEIPLVSLSKAKFFHCTHWCFQPWKHGESGAAVRKLAEAGAVSLRKFAAHAVFASFETCVEQSHKSARIRRAFTGVPARLNV